jgi:hypothetical protein
VTVPSVQAGIEMSDVALRSYFLTSSTEPKLTNPDEVQEAMKGLKVSKAPGLEASFPASGIQLRSDFQCGSPHPAFPYNMEAR